MRCTRHIINVLINVNYININQILVLYVNYINHINQFKIN